MSKGKIETYIGFCIKSGKITLGSGGIYSLKSGVYLIIVDAEAAKNTQKLEMKIKNRFSCPLIVCKSGFEAAVNKSGCKIAAIRDRELSKAILTSLDETYELYFGGDR